MYNCISVICSHVLAFTVAHSLHKTVLSCGVTGQSRPTVRTTDQSTARRLGGEMGFFPTHKLTTRTTCVACPGNLAGLKLPQCW